MNLNKFNHSIKVPRIYKTVAKIIEKVRVEGKSTKSLVYDAVHENPRVIYLLAAQVLQNADVLDFIIRNSNILIEEPRLNPWLARVLIYELLFGKKYLSSDSKPVQTVLKYEEKLKKCLDEKQDVESSHENKKGKIPRYVRINILQISVLDAIGYFRDEGWMLLRNGDNNDYASYLEIVSSLSSNQFIVDMHVPELLVFPPQTQFYNHHLYINKSIILQDKASCLSPLLLNPSPNSTVLDMCAAPGNKSSQLAAMVGENGKIYAVERDQKRFDTLQNLMQPFAPIVECINKDVTTIYHQQVPNVEYILVDPSCSGSGLLDRIEFNNSEEKCDKFRLNKLAGFQIVILRHALTNFPLTKRIVYSTCSIYPEENEYVLQEVLRSNKNFKLIDLQQVMKGKWFNFGTGSNDENLKEIGKRCLFSKTDEDLTTGFFVAVLERLNEGETNEFFTDSFERNENSEEVVNNHNHNDAAGLERVNKNKNKEFFTDSSFKRNKKSEKVLNKHDHDKSQLAVFKGVSKDESNEFARNKNSKKTVNHVPDSIQLLKINEKIKENNKNDREESSSKKRRERRNNKKISKPQEISNESINHAIKELSVNKNVSKKKISKHNLDKAEDTKVIQNELKEITNETFLKKKKKRNLEETEDSKVVQDRFKETIHESVKKKKKRNLEDTEEPKVVQNELKEIHENVAKKKKKRNLEETEEPKALQNELKEVIMENITKKKKKRNLEETEEPKAVQNELKEITNENVTKKKKKHNVEETEEPKAVQNELKDILHENVTKKKKKRNLEETEEPKVIQNELKEIKNENKTKKKKKRNLEETEEPKVVQNELKEIKNENKTKKKKKRNLEETEELNVKNGLNESLNDSVLKKKKKKHNLEVTEDSNVIQNELEEQHQSTKAKKSKRQKKE